MYLSEYPNMVLIVASILTLVLIVAALLIARRLGKPRNDLPLSPEWINDLSTDKYRSMMRLLSRRDLDNLRSRPDYSTKMAAEFRRERSHLFSEYLNAMSVDFERICMAIRVLMLNSSYDRPDLASTLIQSQFMFKLAIANLRMRVFFYTLGWCEGDASEVFRIFDAMRLELRNCVPAGAAA
jgi:hypothetical protein